MAQVFTGGWISSNGRWLFASTFCATEPISAFDRPDRAVCAQADRVCAETLRRLANARRGVLVLGHLDLGGNAHGGGL